MSIPRRLGRLARGFVSNLQEDERMQERLRSSRARGETLKDALGAAWRGASEEWRASEERRRAEEQEQRDQEATAEAPRFDEGRSRSRRPPPTRGFVPRRYPVEVLSAYRRLDLASGAPLEEVHKRRRDLIKKYHPDRFADPKKRAMAERATAEINSAHDTITRYKARK